MSNKRRGHRGILAFSEEEWIEEHGHLADSQDTRTAAIRVYLSDSEYFHFGLACIRRNRNLSQMMREFMHEKLSNKITKPKPNTQTESLFNE